ncbi:MAG: glutathione S-transferase family protein [Burkholderiaceae bacterium]
MIRLYQFEPAFGLPNASPFCMKVETYLRMAGLPFETVDGADVLKAPKRKLPYIDDDGRIVEDSSFIIEHLKASHGDRLDGHLTPEERAISLAFQRLLEENSYWVAVYWRWADEANWPATREAFFGKMPAPLRWFVPALARRGVLAQLRGHGMGRHSAEDITAIGRRDVDAVADFLGEKAFMLGDRPTTLDATAYAFLANLLWAPPDSPVQRHARTRPTLEAYCQRMKIRYYGS